MNSLISNAANWVVDFKYVLQTKETLERVKFDLEDGILSKLQAERQRELEEYIVKNCFQNKTYNYLQALKCEEFHLDNDYKQNILKNFFKDHLAKHLKEYELCYLTPEFERLRTVEEKDRAFLECHQRWNRNFRHNVSQELEVRARELFQ